MLLLSVIWFKRIVDVLPAPRPMARSPSCETATAAVDVIAHFFAIVCSHLLTRTVSSKAQLGAVFFCHAMKCTAGRPGCGAMRVLPAEAFKSTMPRAAVIVSVAFRHKATGTCGQGCRRCSCSTVSLTAVALTAPLAPMQGRVSNMLCWIPRKPSCLRVDGSSSHPVLCAECTYARTSKTWAQDVACSKAAAAAAPGSGSARESACKRNETAQSHSASPVLVSCRVMVDS